MSKPPSGSERTVQAPAETWRLTLWKDGRAPGDDAVSVELERHGHNFPGSLNARDGGALIDALLELLPDAREYSRLAGRRAARC